MAQNRWTSHIVGLLLVLGLVAALWTHRIYLDEPRLPAITAADLVRHAHPTAAFLHRELNAGNLPIWNPYQMAGEPALALHVTGFLYPPNLLGMWLLPAARALEALTVMHLAIAAFFSWLFAARLGLGLAARAVVTVAYTLSGGLLMGVYLFPCLMVQTWLPAIMWAVHGLASEAKLRWALVLALTLSLAFLGGYAQGLVYELLLALPYGVLALFVIARPGTRMRVARLAGASGLLALGLVAPQLLPTLELSAQSVRSLEGVPYSRAAFFSATPALLLDGLLGPFADGFGSWAPLRWRLALPLLFLPLLMLGSRLRELRAQWLYFAAAFAIAGLFMLGSNAFVFPLFYWLPLGDLFRGPIFLAFVYAFVAALLLGIGVEGLAEQLRRFGLRRRLVVAVTALVALGVCADFYSRSSLDVEHPAVSDSIGEPEELIEVMTTRLGRPRVFLQAFGWHAQYRFKFGMANGVFAVPDYESNLPMAYARYFGVDPGSWHGELSVLRRSWGREVIAETRLLDLMSVRFYAAKRSGSRETKDPNGLPDRLVARTLGNIVFNDALWLLIRPAALPRVYTVNRVRREPDLDSLLATLRSSSFEPLGEVALLSGDGDTGGLAAGRPAGGANAGGAEITSYETEQVEISARCASECLLVLTDLYFPGWSVSVDGADAKMLRVNALFRGVMLSPGKHEVVYRYQPASFRNGLLLAAASFACIAACALYVVVTGREGAEIASR